VVKVIYSLSFFRYNSVLSFSLVLVRS